MIEIVILTAFFGALAIGAVVADRLGLLPSAEEELEEDRVREAGYDRAL